MSVNNRFYLPGWSDMPGPAGTADCNVWRCAARNTALLAVCCYRCIATSNIKCAVSCPNKYFIVNPKYSPPILFIFRSYLIYECGETRSITTLDFIPLRSTDCCTRKIFSLSFEITKHFANLRHKSTCMI